MIGRLPKSLTINGTTYEIRTDFRDIIRILLAFADKDLEPREKAYVLMAQVYPGLASIPKEDYEEAYMQALAFVSCESAEQLKRDKKKHPQVIDWEKDEMLLFPAVNHIAGFEVRSVEYLHWWTFLAAYMEVGDCLFAQVVSIRNKKARGKKLEKYEQQFYREHRAMVDLKPKVTEAEKNLFELWGPKPTQR